MKAMLKHTKQLFSPAEAESVAQKLAANDPDWTYKVVHDPKGTGYSFIAVYDEDGAFVENF